MYTKGIRKIFDSYATIGVGVLKSEILKIVNKTKYEALNFNGDIYVKTRINGEVVWVLTPLHITDFETN